MDTLAFAIISQGIFETALGPRVTAELICCAKHLEISRRSRRETTSYSKASNLIAAIKTLIDLYGVARLYR